LALTRFALTVQSSAAIECASRGIPVFLCGWLASSLGGYAAQYERFQMGTLLHSAEQLADIPDLLRTSSRKSSSTMPSSDSARFRDLLAVTWPLSA
jgi:hypothetical protein